MSFTTIVVCFLLLALLIFAVAMINLINWVGEISNDMFFLRKGLKKEFDKNRNNRELIEAYLMDIQSQIKDIDEKIERR